MAKMSRSSKARRIEAIERSQRLTQFFEDSTNESDALLGSAGESRPSSESHILDLLESSKAERSLESLGSHAKKAHAQRPTRALKGHGRKGPRPARRKAR
ncbi:MAG: hypothetical protein M1354_02450 [Candidatus Marsarchaeota archaeon]|jgi:hypothetical protein|nr:hypothetical protein [Candidatus Marsarchaeota archaeon]